MPGKPIDIEEARRLVLERVAPLGAEEVPVGDALGRVLAEPVRSADPVPGFDNSAMDGFAVRAADTAGAAPGSPATLRIAAESRAGRPASAALQPGEAFAISTGAALPAGADAVVRIEDAEAADGRVLVSAEVEPGRDVRRAGEDIEAGDRVLAPGTALGPAELGVLVSAGRAEARCARRPRVRVVVTGDELLEPGEPMRPGGVRNSNAHTVPALARLAGAEVASIETAGDEAAATRAAIERALDADVAVVCGGVSVGEHDHVRPALRELGAEEVFWGVALRPGGPTWFGTMEDTLVFGLPGNPVSAIVTFVLFARPALRAMAGTPTEPDRTTVILDVPYEAKKPGRAHAVRCRLRLAEDGWHATPTGPQGSHILTSMLGADALAILPAAAGPLAAGEQVEVELLPRL